MPNGGAQSTAKTRVDKAAASLALVPKTAEDRRLPVEECRKILGSGCEFTDEQVKSVRDLLYAMARMSIEEFAKGRGSRESWQSPLADNLKAA
jgi:hypothetical protein